MRITPRRACGPLATRPPDTLAADASALDNRALCLRAWARRHPSARAAEFATPAPSPNRGADRHRPIDIAFRFFGGGRRLAAPAARQVDPNCPGATARGSKRVGGGSPRCPPSAAVALPPPSWPATPPYGGVPLRIETSSPRRPDPLSPAARRGEIVRRRRIVDRAPPRRLCITESSFRGSRPGRSIQFRFGGVWLRVDRVRRRRDRNGLPLLVTCP